MWTRLPGGGGSGGTTRLCWGGRGGGLWSDTSPEKFEIYELSNGAFSCNLYQNRLFFIRHAKLDILNFARSNDQLSDSAFIQNWIIIHALVQCKSGKLGACNHRLHVNTSYTISAYFVSWHPASHK